MRQTLDDDLVLGVVFSGKTPAVVVPGQMTKRGPAPLVAAGAPVLEGQVRTVYGYGLMQVVAVDVAAGTVGVAGHGAGVAVHWFPVGRLGTWATRVVLERERAEAAARGVACVDPLCWCRRSSDGRELAHGGTP